MSMERASSPRNGVGSRDHSLFDAAQEALVPPKVKESLTRFDDQVRTAATEHPVLALLGAALLGYFAGRVVSRI